MSDIKYEHTTCMPSTIKPELVGTGTNLMIHPSGAQGGRVAMYGAHQAQTPIIDGAEQRTLFTGFEKEYAKYMFNVIVEEDCVIKKVIHRYAKSSIFGKVLETVVFTEITENKKIGCIVIPNYVSNHEYFGYELIRTPACDNMAVGTYLKKGTILAETPSVIGGEFCNGVQANVILVSHPQVIEDACVISKRLADKLNSYAYKTFRLFVGGNTIPLFLYGSLEDPKIHPDVGEKVRPDGILFATRSYDPLLGAVECSARALREPCTHFDNCVITDKESIVTDVKVYRDDNSVTPNENGADKPHVKMHTPSYIQATLDEYNVGLSNFNSSIRAEYCKIKAEASMGLSRNKQTKVSFTPQANQVIRDAIAYNPNDVPGGQGKNKRKQFNRDLMEDYVVEITIRYPIPMEASGKLTDPTGGKGIVGEVRENHLMPYDKYGREVDIMMADNAVLRRTIFTRPFESYVNAASRDASERAVEMYDAGNKVEAWEYISAYIDIAAPEFARILIGTLPTDELKFKFVDWLRDHRLRLWIPSDSEKGMAEVEYDIERYFPPKRSTLTFTNRDGKKVETKEEFIIGSIYILRLDKTGRESFSISAGKYQQFGTIAKQHSADKYRRPIREQPIKFLGESELRHLCAYCPDLTTAELHDRSNNPAVMDALIRTVLTHETPTNIDCAVDRDKYPLGNNRTMLIVNHVFECEGVKFTNRRGNITETSPVFEG